MPRGKRSGVTEGHKKADTPADVAELHTSFSDEEGNMTCGMLRGLPAWVHWFVGDREPSSQTEEGYNVYDTTEAERAAYPKLADLPQVIIHCDDVRHERNGFRHYVILPEGIPAPDYDAFKVETEARRVDQEAKDRSKRKRPKKDDHVEEVVEQIETQGNVDENTQEV